MGKVLKFNPHNAPHRFCGKPFGRIERRRAMTRDGYHVFVSKNNDPDFPYIATMIDPDYAGISVPLDVNGVGYDFDAGDVVIDNFDRVKTEFIANPVRGTIRAMKSCGYSINELAKHFKQDRSVIERIVGI